ncbi:MAG TPA: MraY family glycosyltransferase [Chitinispirillaceae bacterium]|nr:MraY family glycosyltransferase [Chitinispirillaceae bacterium]
MFKNTVDISIPFSKNIVQVLLLSSVIIFICGFLDDTTFITMRVRYKIAAELIIALSTVYLFNINFGQISIFGFFFIPLWVSKLLSVLWIMGLINAFNMIDGVDGLAGGISLISILTLAAIAHLGGLPSIFTVCLILTGTIIGFLLYNLPPAKTFMGDTGSLFLGTMIAVISLYLSKEIVTSRAMVVMPLIAGVPIIEVIVTMVRRYFKAKDSGFKLFGRLHSMIVADNSHIHHRLVYLGFSHLETTTMLCTLSFTLCCGALCLFLIPSYASIFLIFYLAVPVVFVLDQLGFGGRFKKALHLSATRYNGYKKKSLVGVIDQEGTTFHLLKKQNNQDIEYVPITDEEISGISRYLKAVIVNKNSKDSENCIGYAEQVSTLIKGPIFIVSPDTTSKVSILEVFKNGSLNVKEKKGSILQLAKEMKKVSAGNVYTHH